MINIIWPRFLKSAYRKEPISAFILIIGAVDVVMGGVEQRWTLLSFGVTIVFLSALMRWLQIQKAQTILAQESPRPRHFLPPSSSQAPLPMLINEKNRR